MGGVTRVKMHDGEIQTSPELVRRLLEGQMPEWAGLPIELVVSYGTDHDIYRLGKHLAVRLPRISWATDQAAKEANWLPRLVPHLPLAVPVQLAMGQPAAGYPFSWSVYEWLPGKDASSGLDDLNAAAVDLADFVKALRKVDRSFAPQRQRGERGGPLAERDQQVRRSIATLGTRIDAAAVIDSWEESLGAEPWTGEEVWIHGDLLPGNLLTTRGRLSAVIDWGSLNTGDPACDLIPAWNTFSGESRHRFRTELTVDSPSWLRGRGWALCQAVMAMPYYWDTNPGIVEQASRALDQVLDDTDGS
ncbi:MAG: aminoglycoside phosphotransferase family protein [Acidimicrobiia bacterium]|nr:aminoglycoside phosphotransferase family protein [Acidimicrobiia bacterium]MDH5505462.1 aminoglycoside phosphotransferase family protein [Acidimicrobiia bacterium]